MADIAIKIFKGILDHYNEKLYNAYSGVEAIKKLINQKVKITNESVLREAINKGKGVILVTGHFGGIEFLPSVVAMKGYPISIICRFQNQLFSERIRERAAMVGIDIIETDKMNTIKAALLALKNNRILVTECDELNKNIRKIRKDVYFLGYKINYDRTIDVLQKKSGSAVLFGLLKREPGKSYELIIYDEIMNTEESNLEITIGEKCLKFLEKAIYAHPEQWYQWNKFGQIVLNS
jgi:Kdo2-lipid IVA lauroyltransferase/acyltransferase